MAKRNENPIRTSLHDEVFTHLPSSLILLNRRGEVLYMNPSAERLLGVSITAACKKTLGDLIQGGEELLQPIQEVLETGRSIKIHETEILGSQAPLLLQVEMAPIGALDNPSGVILWINELSTTQALQEEIRVQDRLAMMGTIASGLAHEIRNPLGGIRAAAQMFSRETSHVEEKEYADIILSEVDRLNHLITELLDFSKPKRIKKSPVNINKILSELLALNEELMREKRIEWTQHFDPSLPPVYGHAPSLKQAFLNLIKNALEAMEGGGNLIVSTSFHSNIRTLLGEGPSGAMAEVLIQDTGVGIPKKYLNSLFTPFFTTKPHGTGLGLMMTQRILKEHRGSLRVKSVPGKGSLFRVFLRLATPSSKD